ncbi:caspase, EACC1-associated type [Streptomyces sp. NPDC001515]
MSGSPWGTGLRDALLIATGTYDDGTLRTLRSPGQDCAVLADVLADPAIGAFRTEQVKDAPAHQAMRAIERFFRNRSLSDLLLLHVSCHGIKDDDGHLYFAARDTDPDLLASTAVPAAFLRDRMDRCRARTIVVILDCCYSGAFLPGAKGDRHVHVNDELAGHGRAVLTATNRTEYAWEGHHVESVSPQPSRFTGALIEGLRTGDADLNGDGRITVTELHEYVYESLLRSGARQHPRIWLDQEYQVTIARVAAPALGPLPDPPDPGPLPDPAAPGSPPGGAGSAPENPVRPYARPQRGQDAKVRLACSLEETGLGTQKDLTIETAAVCALCAGSGWGSTPTRCQDCEDGKRAGQVKTCRTCRGRGLVGACCPKCEGQGRAPFTRTLTVKIPAGVDHGTRIRFAGEAEAGTCGGPAGDLYAEIVELKHPVFERDGDDLRCSVAISHAMAESGGTRDLDTLDGKRTLRIPPGIHDRAVIRYKGLGATHLREGGRGDILVRVDVRD